MPAHDFTTYALGVPAGYVGDGFGADWEIADVPSVGRRLYVPNSPSFTWLQTGSSAVITEAVIEFEAPDPTPFSNISVGIRANGVELASFTHADVTLRCATYGAFEIVDPIPARLRLEVTVDTVGLTVTATLKNADTSAILGTCSDSIFAAPASAFGMFVGGYPAAIEATISRFEWTEEGSNPPVTTAEPPAVINPIETTLPPEPYPNTNIALSSTPSAGTTITPMSAVQSDLSGDVLRGFDNTGYVAGKPKRLSGRSKLEDDIWKIASRVMLEVSLKARLISSEQGILAARIKRELENSENWWAGQETPIVLQRVVITRRDIALLGGVALAADPDGDLAIQINYLERSVGIGVARSDGENLTIPFGAFDGGS